MWRSAIAWTTEASARIADLMMLAIVALVVVEVVCRSFLNLSLQFADEVAGYLLVAILFLGVTISFRSGTLLRVEFLLQRLPRRWRLPLEILFLLIAFLFVLVLDYALIKYVLSTHARGMQAPTLLATPLYIPQAVMPIGATLLAIALLGAVVEKLCAAVGGRDDGDRGGDR